MRSTPCTAQAKSLQRFKVIWDKTTEQNAGLKRKIAELETQYNAACEENQRLKRALVELQNPRGPSPNPRRPSPVAGRPDPALPGPRLQTVMGPQRPGPALHSPMPVVGPRIQAADDPRQKVRALVSPARVSPRSLPGDASMARASPRPLPGDVSMTPQTSVVSPMSVCLPLRPATAMQAPPVARAYGPQGAALPLRSPGGPSFASQVLRTPLLGLRPRTPLPQLPDRKLLSTGAVSAKPS